MSLSLNGVFFFIRCVFWFKDKIEKKKSMDGFEVKDSSKVIW